MWFGERLDRPDESVMLHLPIVGWLEWRAALKPPASHLLSSSQLLSHYSSSPQVHLHCDKNSPLHCFPLSSSSPFSINLSSQPPHVLVEEHKMYLLPAPPCATAALCTVSPIPPAWHTGKEGQAATEQITATASASRPVWTVRAGISTGWWVKEVLIFMTRLRILVIFRNNIKHCLVGL